MRIKEKFTAITLQLKKHSHFIYIYIKIVNRNFIGWSNTQLDNELLVNYPLYINAVFIKMLI